jgi:Zn-dependent protease with chaperone function
MMTAILPIGFALVVMPHALDLSRVRPAYAAALWLVSLVVRAAAVLAVIAWLVVVVPRSDIFIAATQWCWHAVIPYVAAHVKLNGHGIGDAALFVPLLAVSASAAATAYGVLRAARAVRSYLRRCALGPGPGGSVIVPGREILLAAAGITRPQVLVSAGALLALDDDELAVGLEHERAHIARRHRWLLLTAELARGVGRPIPGSTAALRELSLHLERDADRWALDRLDDRLALASVICKAATGSLPSRATAPLGGTNVATRVGELMDERKTKPRCPAAGAGRLLAVCLVAAVVGAAAPVPGAMALPAAANEIRHCPS